MFGGCASYAASNSGFARVSRDVAGGLVGRGVPEFFTSPWTQRVVKVDLELLKVGSIGPGMLKDGLAGIALRCVLNC